MDLYQKLTILADSAKYDASCASSGSRRANTSGLGNTSAGGICHSYAADGRCISLLKILMTNICIYDCKYCINRRSNDIRRAIFRPEELAELTIEYYRRNYIEGLFLSSGVVRTPDYTMELLIRTLVILRSQHKFNGYIHVKIIPGASADLVGRIGRLADRVSVNLELPSRTSLAQLAPEKKPDTILQPMRQVKTRILQYKEEKKILKHTPYFAPAGQSTQLIIGASPETDYQIIHLGEKLYKTIRLKRVYYSAYIPVNHDPGLPHPFRPPLLREHRLYQADWLIRLYGYQADEILDETRPHLSVDYDPKVNWALNHPDFFPIEVNSADYEAILRVPGIGLISAQRMVAQRRVNRLTCETLKKMGVVLKRAQYFITINGRYFGTRAPDDPLLAETLSERKSDRADQLAFDFEATGSPS